MSDEIDPQRFEAMATRLDAMREEIWDLEEENERLRDRIAELETVVGPNMGEREWETLTREEKAFQLRRALMEKALSTGGRAAMTYDEVRATFNYNPSLGHAYDLMRIAGELEGFNYDENAEKKRVTVKLDAVNDETLVHAVKNRDQPTPA